MNAARGAGWVGMALVGFALAGCPKSPRPATESAMPGRGVRSEWATEGDLLARLSHAPADLAIFHAGEQRGSLATCGCPRRPRGSLARFVGWVHAARATAPAPDLVVNAGSFLADAVDYMGQPRLDALEMDRWMMRGMALAGFDAVNVSAQDIGGLTLVPPEPGVPLVSANVLGPGIAPFVLVEREGMRIGITGVSGPAASLADPRGYRVLPLEQAAPVLEDLVGRTDLVVLLAWGATDPVRSLVRRVPGVDVVVDAAVYSDAPEAGVLGGTFFTHSVFQTVQAGELRLRVDDGVVVAALDRHVDLDDVAPEHPPIAALAAEARSAIDAVQKQLYGP